MMYHFVEKSNWSNVIINRLTYFLSSKLSTIQCQINNHVTVVTRNSDEIIISVLVEVRNLCAQKNKNSSVQLNHFSTLWI